MGTCALPPGDAEATALSGSVRVSLICRDLLPCNDALRCYGVRTHPAMDKSVRKRVCAHAYV
jgi:hypothetical protein